MSRGTVAQKATILLAEKGWGRRLGSSSAVGRKHIPGLLTTGRFSPKLMEMFIVKKKCKDVKYVS